MTDTNRYPYGYKRPDNGGPQGMGTLLTWSEMMTKSSVKLLHDEVLRRFKALIEFAHSEGVPLGVGTGWRVQPDPPPQGFAKPGNSWHESCPTKPSSDTALAIDTVPNISWDWMERNCAAYGFRTFRNVNNEPWHIQPSEITAGRKYATELPPLKHWILPGDKPKPPDPVPPTPIDPGELDSMLTVDYRAYDSRVTGGSFKDHGTGRSITIPFAQPDKPVLVNLTAIGVKNSGYFAVSWDGHMSETSRVQVKPGESNDNLCYTRTNPGGAIDVYLGGDPKNQPEAHIIIDVQGLSE